MPVLILSKPAWAQVAQLVEHCTENAGVGGSIPPLGTNSCISWFFNLHHGAPFPANLAAISLE
jgi:hypothetical protein